ncbi:GNAT family N-acetyltransferase [Flexivirga sp. ID2601S]|uniref:GNAT family N-acetyltransferase n=1 Tax=Flexivirga aerilata TaxID=1656889 RepID=A0A849AL31_9MICO|nr:GNAT family N-acetyltransferase [Flexivirga aerilata]NNG40236.1 GNAT family N-acetyltransferase [Flexivirga aerilata]
MPVYPDDVPELADERVVLRALREQDLPRVVEFATDPASRASIALPAPYGDPEARAFLETVRAGWESGTDRIWAVEFDGEWAGTVSLNARVPGTAEIGYAAHPDVRGQGVVADAARLVIAHAFGELGLRVLQWRATRGNWASRRVGWALGFGVDGIAPASRVDAHGQVADTWYGHLRAGERVAPRNPWFEPAELTDGSVRLRPWREDDAPQDEGDAAITRFLHGTAPTTDDFAEWLMGRRERMAVGEGVFWCIADAADDRPLGGIQLFRMNLPMQRDTALLAYWLQPHARGRGALGRALELLVPHAFSPPTEGGLGLRRLGGLVDSSNLPSQRALRAAGFRQTGVADAVLTYDDGTVADENIFELLASDDRDAQRRTALPVPTLRTARLVLRAWGDGDAPTSEPEGDPVIVGSMGIDPRPPAASYDRWLAELRADALSGGAVRWCVTDAGSGRVLGAMSVRGLDAPLRSGTVAYWLLPEARGNGVTAEALKAVVDHAFSADGLALERLAAETVADNHASMLTLADAGFRQWGQDHQSFVTADGTAHDSAYFELLASEYAENHETS